MTGDGLARKYATMLRLREAHARGEGVASNATLRALAEEFPGALHEIDRLPLALLQTRCEESARFADAPSHGPPWMRHVAAWHALLAATLRAKREGTLRGDAGALARSLTEASGVRVDEDAARGLGAPAGGRVVPWVIRAVAAHFREDEAVVRMSLFPWRD